ncbi:Disease resistance protein [Quillaja saponaria]|uniref:Disease resistance protein n=1 Tax=Quillaja saponaria TaxID=32244 RepID=A0AAD7VFM0_QUISA|nr:Disease resistance protein [Quillaja saponaria]
MTEPGDSSTSSFIGKWSYHVFLSFRGKDIRTNFLGHLDAELTRKGIIKTFKDDEELKGGEKILGTLFKAIEESRISIIVFSKNYASSTWCLKELVEILDCKRKKNQTVLPVFFRVKPSELREVGKERKLQNQEGRFVKAMAEHEKNEENMVDSWKKALVEAAGLKGFELGKDERSLIEEIIKSVSTKLNRILLHVTRYPVGVMSRTSEVIARLSIGTDDGVRMVGIHGMSGIGKTEIAKAVYNLIAGQFEGGMCFLADVRNNSIDKLQMTLLDEILGDENIKLGRNPSKGISIIKDRLQGKKVLFVLDDVNKLVQLTNLADPGWFGLGSRIIITTRDQRLLTDHRVEHIYEVKQLSDDESLQLVSWHGFGKGEPDVVYADVSNRVVHYCNGLPFALERIGSHLHGEPIKEWELEMKDYEIHLPKEIYEKLYRDFEELVHGENKFFLDIACFFEGEPWKHVKNLYNAETYLKNLQEKSLLALDEDKILRMQDLLRRLGRQIIRQEAENPWERSRLWAHEEVIQVISQNKGTDKIKGLKLDLPKVEEVKWHRDAFNEMKNLRILIIQNAPFGGEPIHIPDNLEYFEWQEYTLFRSRNPQISEEQVEEAENKGKETIGNKCAVPQIEFSGNLKCPPDAGGANSVVVHMPCCSLEPCNSDDFDLVMDILGGYGVKVVVQNISSLPENKQTELLKLVLPIVLVEGKYFRGLKEVMQVHNSGELRKILSTTSSSVEKMNDNKEKTIYEGFDNCPLYAADDAVLVYTRCSSLGICKAGDLNYLKKVMERYRVKIEVRDNSLCKNHERLLKPSQKNNRKVVLPIVFVKGRCLGGKSEVLKLSMSHELSDILTKTSAKKNDNNKGTTIFASFDHGKRIKQQITNFNNNERQVREAQLKEKKNS